MVIHTAKKRFGQNFLVDGNIIEKILHAIRPQRSERIVEIGPGLGALTLPLLSLVGKIDAIELDKDLIPILKKKAEGIGNLTLHQQDVLTFALDTLCSDSASLRIIGNLPYNISTPLLFHLFDQKDLIIDMHFMLQQEVAQRLAAEPGSKRYGRLSIMAQYHCAVDLLVTVPPTAFDPPPKVYSSFVRLVPIVPAVKAKDIHLLDNIVKTAFAKRRKTLSNALKGVISILQLQSLDIDPSLRPEQISLENYVKMSNLLCDE